MKVPKVNDIVEVHFLDHVWHEDDSGEGLAPCVAWGIVEKVTKQFIHIVCWTSADHSTQGKEAFSIARGCITKIRRLR